MADESSVYSNAIGDSWLNRCYINIKFFQFLGDSYTPLLGWSEPYVLLLLIMVLLIILPSLFFFQSNKSYLKITRLYNKIRLGLMSILHQIGYTYTIVNPLSLCLRIPKACKDQNGFALQDYEWPDAIFMSGSIFLFAVVRFSGAKSFKMFLLFGILLLAFSLFQLGMEYSFFASIVSVPFSYILHYIHIKIPFKYIHIENTFLMIINVTVFVWYLVKPPDDMNVEFGSLFFVMWFPFVIIIIDEFLMTRHQITRGNFSVIERPIELQWNVETQHVETIRLLNSEEEETFPKKISADLITSLISFFFFYFAILARRLVAMSDFFKSDNR